MKNNTSAPCPPLRVGLLLLALLIAGVGALWPSPRYEVLLGLLGRDVRNITTCPASPIPLLR